MIEQVSTKGMSEKMNVTIPHKKPLKRGITLAGSKTKPTNCFQLPNQSATTQSKPTLQTTRGPN